MPVLLSAKLVDVIQAMETNDPETRRLALQLYFAIAPDDQERRSLLLDRLTASNEDVSLKRFALQHFPRTDGSADKQIVERVLKAWGSEVDPGFWTTGRGCLSGSA